MPPRARLRPILPGLLLLTLVVLLYWPGLSGGFLLDDYPHIVHQDAVHMVSLDAEALQAALGGFNHALGRQIPMASFALDHLAWGLDPWGYKLTGVLVHAVNALLVFVLLLRLLPAASRGTSTPNAWLPAGLAAAWALHPLQVSTVLYVVQRMETLSLLFVLMALVAYLAGRMRQQRGERGWPWLVACVPLVALGLACKESAALFPGYTLVIELAVLRFSAHRPATARMLRLAYASAFCVGLVVAAWLTLEYQDPAVYAIRDYTAWERLLTQARVLPMYLGWILVPDPGAYVFYYDQFEPSRGLLEPATTLAGLVGLLAMAAAALAASRRLPLFALGIGWFLVAHAITSSVVPLELVFEHRNYFALLGIVLATHALASRLLANRVSGRVAATLGAIVLVTLAGLTGMRAATWGNPLHLALELAQKNPESPRAGTGLGDQYLLMAAGPDDPFVSLARAEYERAAVLPDSSPIPDQALVIMAARLDRAAEAAWWDRLVGKLQRRPIGPQEMAVVTSLLDLRNDGLAIDDRRLADAYTVLSRRMALPPTQYFAFAVHALVDLHDATLAEELLRLTALNADGNEALLSELSAYLESEGMHEASDFLERAPRQ